MPPSPPSTPSPAVDCLLTTPRQRSVYAAACRLSAGGIAPTIRLLSAETGMSSTWVGLIRRRLIVRGLWPAVTGAPRGKAGNLLSGYPAGRATRADLDRPHDGWEPTAEEIRRACEEIRRGWNPFYLARQEGTSIGEEAPGPSATARDHRPAKFRGNQRAWL